MLRTLNLFAIPLAVAKNLRGNSFILSRWHRVMAHGVLKPAAQPTDDPLVAVAESGRLRLTRSKLLAKRPHSGGHWPEKQLNNVGEDLWKTSGRPPTFFFSYL